MEMNLIMVDDFSKKVLGITLLILIVGVFYFNTKITSEKAYQELDNYLYQTYGE